MYVCEDGSHTLLSSVGIFFFFNMISTLLIPHNKKIEFNAKVLLSCLRDIRSSTVLIYGKLFNEEIRSSLSSLLPKYQPKRGGDLGWGKLFRFKCGIKNYLQIAKVDLANVWSQFNCNIDMIWNQAQVYI